MSVFLFPLSRHYSPDLPCVASQLEDQRFQQGVRGAWKKQRASRNLLYGGLVFATRLDWLGWTVGLVLAVPGRIVALWVWRYGMYK